MSEDRVLGTIDKNARELLQVRSTTFNGIELVDVRCWLKPVGAGDPTPTKKGLSLRPATWRELLPEIAAAIDDD